MASLDIDEELMTITDGNSMVPFVDKMNDSTLYVHLRSDDEFDWEAYM